MQEYGIDKRTQTIIYLLLYLAFQFIVLDILFYNKENQFFLSMILGIYLCITVFRHFFMKVTTVKYLFPIIEVILIFSVNYLDVSSKSQMLFILIVADIVVGYVFVYSITFSIFGLIIFLVMNILKENNWTADSITQYLMVVLISYSLIVLAFITMKKQMVQNKKYKNLLDKLIEKTNEAEELVIFKERNRIAGEIHDTVGHTLTTVLIQIEAGRMLIDKNPELAKEKIGIAKEQVRKGLNDIRSSVKSIKSGEQLLDFCESLKSLCKELQKTIGCKIQHSIVINSDLIPIQEKIIYSAVQEALTNGLKHGKARKFEIEVIENDGKIYITIVDNGNGTEDINFGFGLTNMTERVKSIGGKIDFQSKLLEGFKIKIVIPVGK